MTATSIFHSNGKLLLSGEYFVLDGAKAVGLPCRFGQSLKISPFSIDKQLDWKSYNKEGQIWFSAKYSTVHFDILECTDKDTAAILRSILCQARVLQPDFLQEERGLASGTYLEFERLWGLGSSSTLLSNIAQWAGVNPFDLSNQTLGGSGYDIACATAKGPIMYQLEDEKPSVEAIRFNPDFQEQLFFIYLGKKQNSREGIKRYKEQALNTANLRNEISEISEKLITADRLDVFQNLLRSHEAIISQALGLPKIQELYFQDFGGVVKSLGAWGGDFVLAASAQERSAIKNYFHKKGFPTILDYVEMVRQ